MTYRINDNGIDRDMTENEIEAFEESDAALVKETKKQNDALKRQIAARKSAIDKLSALGLTELEIKALVGE